MWAFPTSVSEIGGRPAETSGTMKISGYVSLVIILASRHNAFGSEHLGLYMFCVLLWNLSERPAAPVHLCQP
jgi:hypothetical protein